MNKSLYRAFVLALPMLAGVAGNASAAVGRTEGSFAASPTGAGTYQIPLWVSPGAGGVQPSLTLSYDSQRGVGIMGPGWALTGLSAITRCNRTIAQDSFLAPVRLDYSDQFCMDGKRLRFGAGGFYGQPNTTYETEVADFSLVTLPQVNGTNPVYFTAKTKDGLILEFGNSTDSRVVIGPSSVPYMWLVNKVTDRAGNSYRVTYGTGAAGTVGTAVPISIDYSAATAGGTDYINNVTFVYDSKVAKFPSTTDTGTRSYVAGNLVVNTNLLLELKVSSAGSLVRRYVFDYEQAPMSLRPRLSKLTECASTNLSDCLSSSNFGYQDGSAGVSTSPITVTTNSWFTGATDVDGDGRNDVLYNEGGTLKVARGTASGGFLPPVVVGAFYNGVVGYGDLTTKGYNDIIVQQGTTWTRYTWNGSTFTATPTGITTPTNIYKSGLVDVNGDGRPDALVITQAYNPTTRVYSFTLTTWLNWSPDKNTLTFAAPVTQTIPFPCGPAGAVSPCEAEILIGTEFNSQNTKRMDFNGDGASDLMYRTLKPDIPSATSIGRLRFLAFDGTNYTEIGGLSPFGDDSERYKIVGVGDLNDDDCTDVLYTHPTGGAFISPCFDSAPTSFDIPGTPLATMDWNSDGRSDVLVQYGSNFGVAISTASGVMAVQDTGIPYSALNPINSFVLDYDGDGLQDLVTWNSSGINVYRHASPSKPPDLANSFTDGYGVNASPEYSSILISNYTKGTAATYPERDLDTALYVVTTLTSTSGASDVNAPATYSQKYQYFEGRENLAGRGLEGFKQIQITDQRNGIVRNVYRHTDFPLTGMIYQDDVSQSDGTPISHTETHNDFTVLDNTTNGQSYFPFVDWTSTDTYEVDATNTYNGVPVKRKKVDPSYDNFGNATTIVTTITDINSLSSTANQVWTSTVSNTITPDTSANWCLNMPTVTVVTNTAPGSTPPGRKTNYSPDYAKCRIDSSTIAPDDANLKVVSNFHYDAFGNIDQVTETPPQTSTQTARTTSIYWGATGRQVEQITNAAGEVSKFEWNHSLGVRTKMTDPNDLVTNWTPDSFGRIILETRPDQTKTSFVLSACDSGNGYCGLPGSRVKLDVSLLGPNDAVIRTDSQQFDQFDRLNRTLKQLIGGVSSEVTRNYDVYGRLATEAIPHAVGGATFNTTYSFDLIGRNTKVSRPKKESLPSSANDTTTSYEGSFIRVTDGLGHSTRKHRNPTGNVDEVYDAASGPGKKTVYTFDAFANLTTVTDANGNQTILGYDVLGRKTSSSDPDMGAWSYEYWPLGEIARQTDANNNVTQYKYDAVSRLTERTELEGKSVWSWGTSKALHNVGRLERVEQFDGSNVSQYYEAYTYDPLSRLTRQEINNTAVAYDFGYDPATGKVGSMIYPTSTSGYRLALQYVYQKALLQEVKDASTTYWHANSINAFGQVTQEVLGNGVTTTRSYDGVTARLSGITSGLGTSTALQNENYQYDDAGNLTQRQKYNLSSAGLTENFHYDESNRLKTVDLGGVTSLTLEYDEIGNITKRSDVGNNAIWTYDPAHKHAVKTAGTFAYDYDANGNATKRNGYDVTWTSYNYPSVVNGLNKRMTFSYGPNRERYMQVYKNGDATETTIYIGGAMEKVTNGVDDYRHYIYANGAVAAIVSRKSNGTNVTRYLLNDHLGSVAAILDTSGATVVTESFDSFGGRRNAEDWDTDCNCSTLAQMASITRHGFTGHEMIGGQSMGLIHMNGRVMDSMTGRFLSADPFVQFPHDGQSLNRYSYVRNNPLSATDPSGFSEYGDDIEWPDWDPPLECQLFGCGPGGPTYAPVPRPQPVPKPSIPLSRATPTAIAGPSVLSASSLGFGVLGLADNGATEEDADAMRKVTCDLDCPPIEVIPPIVFVSGRGLIAYINSRPKMKNAQKYAILQQTVSLIRGLQRALRTTPDAVGRTLKLHKPELDYLDTWLEEVGGELRREGALDVKVMVAGEAGVHAGVQMIEVVYGEEAGLAGEVGAAGKLVYELREMDESGYRIIINPHRQPTGEAGTIVLIPEE